MAADAPITGEIANGSLPLIRVGQEDTTAEADRLTKNDQPAHPSRCKRKDKSLPKRRQWRASARLPVHSLCWNCEHGNRPSFTEAGDPKKAEELYEYIIAECRRQIPVVQTGSFGADMKVRLCNDGPFTILLES